ncbi:methyltransferase-like protein 17, mitochondrial [Tribolium madens]|uniref:methyltransferase-like protein 17, mitochondrial n=1 Tax=Tribolium madens TaxID=41895 RepID=UPI001CF75B71|nr:methyltransferase-like protein 17, mitochondrial [Tribolium madens]
MDYFRKRIINYFIRRYTTKVKTQVILDENVLNNIEKNVYNPKKHPGLFKPRQIPIPEAFIRAVTNVIADYPVKGLIEDGKTLINHLRAKKPPVEKDEMGKIQRIVYQKVMEKQKIPQMETEEDRRKFQQVVDTKVHNLLKSGVYNWKPVHYTAYEALVYLMSRSAAEFSVLARIFLEIAERDPGFQPRSLFDFGSGVGTVTWAANLYWKKYIFEYFNVDSSRDMNDLAQILLQDGKGTNKISLRGVFYRQFLPATNTSYDLVVCAYTLLELPSRQARFDTILNLWNKTQKYLVIVEQGTNSGFQVVNEVRDFILHTGVGHIYSPCPHDKVCPRFVLNDGTPCNFEAFYFSLPIGAVSLRKSEKYSYVVLKKGERDPSDPQWPRIIRDTLVRSKHTICRMCTKNANLEEVIFTASKHGKNLYYCARASKLGDLVPVTLQKQDKENDITHDEDESR